MLIFLSSAVLPFLWLHRVLSACLRAAEQGRYELCAWVAGSGQVDLLWIVFPA